MIYGFQTMQNNHADTFVAGQKIGGEFFGGLSA
jgi:hypothetical protein